MRYTPAAREASIPQVHIHDDEAIGILVGERAEQDGIGDQQW